MSAAPLVMRRAADHEIPSAEVTSLTWFEVMPLKPVPPLPQLPAPSLSAQTMATVPLLGSNRRRSMSTLSFDGSRLLATRSPPLVISTMRKR